MIPHDFMTLHTAKMIEYLIAVSYLLLFIPFWRFVNAPLEQTAALAHAPRPAADATEWFAVPDGLFFHPGHAWLRLDGPDTVTVGLDDFARKLVGALSAIELPAVGSVVSQGEPAWTLVADGRAIDMVSPVDGTVVAVNDRVHRSPAVAHDRPYAEGWLLKIHGTRLAANLRQLLTGRLARHWMEDLTASLRGGLVTPLGHVYEDGGAVIDGLAKSIEPDGWDDVARRFLLTAQLDAAPDGAQDAGDNESRGGHHA